MRNPLMLTGKKERRNKNLATIKTTHRITEVNKPLNKICSIRILNPLIKRQRLAVDREPRYNCPFLKYNLTDKDIQS